MFQTFQQEPSDHDTRMLTFIERYFVEKRRAPTVEEIRVGMNMSSKDHVQRDLIRLDSIGYIRRTPKISRGIELLRTASGYDVFTGTLAIPMVGVIAAGLPIPVPDQAPSVYDSLELTRDIVRDTRGVYALRVKGTSMVDALINDGDIVIMRRVTDAENGDMVAVWIKSQEATTLKRFYHEGERVRLQPENQAMQPIYVDPTDIEVQGKVIAVIRHV